MRTTPSAPEVFGQIDTATIAHVLQRAGSPGFESWWSRVASAGFCASPVHLSGHDADGRSVRALGRCKNRRAAVCPSCSQLYAGDTWQLVHTGLSSRPADDDDDDQTGAVAGHPMVFATLTAPSFGAVHTTHRGATGPAARCRPSRDYQRCRHGRPAWCSTVHDDSDARLGEPLCGECYDYRAHVLFAWHAPELWHRFTIALRRLLRRRLRDLGEDPDTVRVSYVKVVELQRRGVPHFHSVIRLDNADTADTDRAQAPDTTVTAADLAVLVVQAAGAVHLDVAGPGGETVTLGFGRQVDAQSVPAETGRTDTGDADRSTGAHRPAARRVAAYLAKYVTKSVAEFGLSTRRLSVQAIDRLDLREHVRTILHTIADLAGLPGRAAMIGWLHTLGYRGHITTKTRRYSTTMGALRARRETWRRARHDNGDNARPSRTGIGDDDADQPQPTRWVFTGSGHRDDGERLLAVSAAARARENRDAARLALTDQPGDDWASDDWARGDWARGDWAGAG